jgi:hypothetical protein
MTFSGIPPALACTIALLYILLMSKIQFIHSFNVKRLVSSGKIMKRKIDELNFCLLTKTVSKWQTFNRMEENKE